MLLGPLPLKIAVDSVVGSDPVPGFLDSLLPGWLTGSNIRILAMAAALQVLIVLATQLHELARYMLRARAGEGLILEFRSFLFRHVQRLSLLFHDTRGTADSLYRIQYDAPAIRDIMVDSMISVFSAVLMLVTILIVITTIDWQLALVALVVSPFLFIFARTYNQRMRPRYREVRGLESTALQVVQEVLGAFRVVKAFGREDQEQDRFLGHSQLGVRARIRLALAEGTFGLLVNMTTALGTAVVLFIGVRNVQSGVLTLGELLMVLAYLTQLYAPLRTISRQVASLQASLASAERAFDLLDEVPDVVDRPGARPLRRSEGAIEFRDVSFNYGTSNPVLRNVSFSIPAGTRLGIEGRTGAGKTTLVSLVARFYDPSAGQILLDGVDLRDYKLADMRGQLAIVLQEPVLFSTTIAENIGYGRPGADHQQIIEAAQSANVHDFIAGLTDGYETLVGERGMRLSGGERQRIALARAFLKDAPILVLDEPTSSVDMLTESGIMEAMERLMAGRTTLMIAHRTSTLDICDARIELDHGSIISSAGKVDVGRALAGGHQALHSPD
ncbi:MAG: xenobiotic-transporting ATPase [SAR202 cluster bacterium Io17-Chloro-G9]|nr:MAG: xenobiotic-transporting ATPase [SAR202 cluster bacterium Io17-Chloro-G9]